ncbi:hypothetical protein J3459_013775 [Metarhizium acridum]|nr:hypothetical protein J3459_013775 [Metarhizium acridum]
MTQPKGSRETILLLQYLFVVNLERLCSEQDRPHILPIQYSYDWIKDTAPYVKPFSLKLNNYMRSVSTDGYNIPGALETHALLDENSITLDPVAGGFPWPTSIRCVRQNIHWQASVDGYTNILRAFIEDKTAQRTPSPGAFTIADMARKELLYVADGSSRFVTYMYPFPDAQVVKMLAEMQCLSLLFDG